MKFQTREHEEARVRKLNELVRSVAEFEPIDPAILAQIQQAAQQAGQSATLAAQKAIEAAGAATAASTSVTGANSALTAAQLARDAAVAKAAEAAQSATSAMGMAAAAAGSATTSQVSATNASLSASSASAQANLAAIRNIQAATNANAAAIQSQAATASADQAGTYASAALTSQVTATTQATNAASSATAAANSAMTAASSSTSAANSATAAQSSQVSAATQASNAAASASAAATSASSASSSSTNAGNSAASAAQYAIISASVGPGAINANPDFAIFTGAAGTMPDGWSLWAGTIGSSVNGYAGRKAWRETSTNAVNQGASQTLTPFASGWYVIEWSYRLESGSNNGAGCLFVSRNASNATLNSFPISFLTEHGAGTVGQLYNGSKLVNCATAGASNALIYAMTNWDSLSGFNSGSAKQITWYRLRVRPATAMEIRDQTALAPLEVTVTQQSSAVATLNSQVAAIQARWSVTIDAGGKITGIQLIGGGGTSAFIVSADQFAIESNGDRPFEVVGGVTYIKKAKIADGAINTQRIEPSAVTVPVTYSSGDSYIGSTSEQTVLEMPGFLSVGDGSGGGCIGVFYATFDGRYWLDSGQRIYFYVDTGAGYSLVGVQDVGTPTSSGDTYPAIPISVAHSLSNVSQVRFKVTATVNKISNAGTFNPSYLTNIKLAVMGGKR